MRPVGRARPGDGGRPVSGGRARGRGGADRSARRSRGGGARGRGRPDRSARRSRGNVGDGRVGTSAAQRQTRFRGLTGGSGRFGTRRPPHARFRGSPRGSIRIARTRQPFRRSRGNVGDGTARARAERRRPGSARGGWMQHGHGGEILAAGRRTRTISTRAGAVHGSDGHAGPRRAVVLGPDPLSGTAAGRVQPRRPPPDGARRGGGHPHLGGDGAAAGLRRGHGRDAARPRRRGPRRRPPDADHLAGPAPGPARPRPPVPVSGVPERPGRCSPHQALGPRRGDGARQSGPPVPATPPGGSRGGVPRHPRCRRRRGVRPAGRPPAAGSAGAAGLDGSAVGAGEGAARPGGRLHRPRHPHARLARRASGPGLGDPPVVASAPTSGGDLRAAGGGPVLTVSVGIAVSMAALWVRLGPACATIDRHATRRLRRWLCRKAHGAFRETVRFSDEQLRQEYEFTHLHRERQVPWRRHVREPDARPARPVR